MGTDEQEWRTLLTSPDTALWVRQVGAREIWMFDLASGRRGTAIGAAAWLGPRAWRWRFGLHAGRMRGFRKYAVHRGRPLWLWSRPLTPDRHYLAFAIEDGLLLACLSPQPADLLRLLDAYDGLLPRAPRAVEMIRERTPDTLLIDLGVGPGPDSVRIALDRLDGEAMVGILDLDGFEGGRSDSAAAADGRPAPPLARAAVARAAISCALSHSQLNAWGLVPAAGWAEELFGFLSSESAGCWYVGIHDPPLTGRFRGLRVPGVTLAFPLRNPSEFSSRLSSLLDRWNARTRWGLITGPMPGDPLLTVVEATGENPYRGLPVGECIAYGIIDGWMVAALSADTLRLLRAVEAAASTSSEGLPAESAAVRFKAHVGRAAETARLTLSVYSLLRLVADADSSAPLRARLDAWADRLDWLRPLGPAEAVAISTPGGLRARFRIEADSEAP